ncbi:CbbQ/NirQ/NorQ/GpvN family protein [Hydrocarboniphaga sp.]|uniref:CbbQ/NirQ/NorQ/GpvN family protein n=1 Tax=Hydrocarboniphaga sp. TaxID=2033016 RepID=UPI003D0B8A7E
MIRNTAYIASGSECDIFLSAARGRLPVLLKGPTGCGKTRFVQAMAAELRRPLITVACHEDLTAGDLVGRFLLRGGETVWEDGPLTRAVRSGAICYLDEVVEARADTTVVIHPLADHRRELNIERLGEQLLAPAEFMLVMSYNPGYQSVLKDLKPSTRQRMVSIELSFPSADVEERILLQETGIDAEMARRLVRLGQAIRQLQHEGLPEAASTRTLVSTALLIKDGLLPQLAAEAAITGPLTDDPVAARHLLEMVKIYMA